MKDIPFPKIVCISLADKLDRREFMRSQFEANHLPYRFLDAIRVDLTKQWPALYNRTKRLSYAKKDLRAGEMGCYMSHRQAWQEFLDSGEELCLVLEDDVQLQKNFKQIVLALCARKDTWDFVRLFGFFKRPSQKLCELYDEHYLVDYLKQPLGTQGYLINRSCAERFLRHTAEMVYPIDNAIDQEWAHRITMLGVEPSVLAHPEIFETTLGSESRVKLPLRQKLSRELYRAGTDMKKQLWVMKKRLRYLLK